MSWLNNRKVILSIFAAIGWVCLSGGRQFQKIESQLSERYLRDYANQGEQREGVGARRRTTGDNYLIVTLVVPDKTDLEQLCSSMGTLKMIEGAHEAPVFVFHLEDDPPPDQKEYLQECTERAVYFPIIDLDDYPAGFVPDPSHVGYKDNYIYSQMHRFWTSTIWDHPAIVPYDVIMRIDQDTCFAERSATLPGFDRTSRKYHSQYFTGAYELNIERVGGMFDFAKDYLDKIDLIPRYTVLWQKVLATKAKVNSVPKFQDTFESIDKLFMQSEEVRYWHRNLTDTPPYGYFTMGWTDDAERFLTAAMFGTPSSIDTSVVPGFVQKDLNQKKYHPKICNQVKAVSK